MKLSIKRFKITNPKLDYTIIEIFDEDKIEEFYKIDTNYYIESENNYSEKKGAIIHYPLGYDIQINGGTIKKIENKMILHTITTLSGSSGSPIITLDNNNIIIGIHKGDNIKKQVNGGIYMKYILDDIEKKLNNYIQQKESFQFIGEKIEIENNDQNIKFHILVFQELDYIHK